MNDEIFEEDLLGLTKPILIYGEGGSGKTLFLKNMIRTKFISNRYLFYAPTKELEECLDDEFIDILRTQFFDTYFSNGDYKKISDESFESIFTSTNQICIFVDALDELDEEKRIVLFEKLSKFNDKYANMHFIFTSRSKNDSSKITKYFNEEPIILELRGINEEDIGKMYDSIDEKYIQKQNDESLFFIDSISKDEFFGKLEYLNDDIKKNPLLISNLIFIYFATKKIPTQSYEIINEAVDIMINDIEKERSVFFSYTDILSKDRLYDMLKYLSFCRALYDERNTSDIFAEYLKNKKIEVDDVGKASVEICKYLRRRSILNGEQIAHNIFRDFFAASYLFDDLYLIKGEVPRLYYTFKKDDSKDNLDDYIFEYFQSEDNDWPVISCDLIFKLDYEIHSLNSRREMNEKHLSFEVFDYTLIKCLRENGMSQNAINTISRLIETDGMYYGDFVKKYL